ncbi:MAG: CBS domain-containing protein [Chromatiales bacterium]|nr:CBS domain-containing protein [Chromatiales bacterium]
MNTDNFVPLDYTTLSPETTYHRPTQTLPERVTARSPAIDVMTDFTQVTAISMGPCATINAAEQRMIASGVRLLLVTEQSNKILGIITLTDIHGDRPMKYLQKIGGGKREEIYLQDIMTPADQLDVLEMRQVEKVMVGDIVETMKRVGRQHALVVDSDSKGTQKLRGIFSTKQISMQLGIEIDTAEIARTFAELDEALAASA